ncbi:lipoyl synthase [bacterium]|nr:MAG: lipoyl synthase [bacterium]
MISRLPAWFKQDLPDDSVLKNESLFSDFEMHTVCREAKCPNLSRCFKEQRFTFLILGNTCTRNCAFCGVNKAKEKLNLDQSEPARIQEVVKKLGLDYVVITSVTRDDLADGGATYFAETIRLIHELPGNVEIEVLIPDLQGRMESLEHILAAKPQVLAHNLETIKRLYADLRPEADYQLSLNLLNKAKGLSPGVVTKSSLILGLGEREPEVTEAMRDLRVNHCDFLTLGQYLAPSAEHYPVKEFITPQQFKRYENIALGLGFKAVLAGPLVRSSYQAKEIYRGHLCMI